MTSLIISDYLIGASSIQDRQLGNFSLDSVHPSEERMDVRRIQALTGIDKHDLRLVLARWDTTYSTGIVPSGSTRMRVLIIVLIILQ